MKKNSEIRAFHFDVRAEENEDNGKFITGRPVVYGSETDLGEFREIIEQGALDNTDLKDIPLFVNHNIDMIPLARSRNNTDNSTMQLSPDNEGMEMRANLDTENNADAKSLWSATGRGDIGGMSFMFDVEQEEWQELDSEKPLRIIKAIRKIWEVSAVVFPAYNETSLSVATRSRADVLENAKATLENVKAEEKRQKILKILEG